MLLYALCLNPLLHLLDEKLTGIRIGRGSAKIVAVAYADDVTIILTTPSDERKNHYTLTKVPRGPNVTYTSHGL